MSARPYTVFNKIDELYSYLARELEHYSQLDNIQHISLSGGSTPKGLFSFIVQSEFKTTINWSNLHFWWGDERCVDFCDSQSNYGEAKRLLFDHIDISLNNLHFIPVDACLSTIAYQSVVESYSKELLRFLGKNNQYPEFDWIILGVGDDGHTASLFPNSTDLETEDLVLLVVKPNTTEYRVSLSANTLRAAKRISYLVTGKTKANIVSDIILEKEASKTYPAYLIHSTSGNTEYLLDTQASRLLVN